MKIFFCVCSVLLLLCQSSIAQEPTLKTADSNSDGKVTVEEFKEYAGGKLPGFDKLDEFAGKVDADSDGEISETEYGNRMQALKAVTAAEMESAPAANGPLAAGDDAADFELQSIDKKIRLSDNFGEEGKPVVVVFSRANW